MQHGDFQLLPCRVPFGALSRDLTPAVQGYGIQQLCDARRYVELTRMGCHQDDSDQWHLRLVEAALCLEQGDGDEAWHQLQLALKWRNSREQESLLKDALPPISINDWLVMATVALSVDKVETAESFASEAIAKVQNEPTAFSHDVLRDSRADAITTFATVRLAQGRFGEAEMLLQLAYEAHELAGDLEQMAVDFVLLADVEQLSGNRTESVYLLCEAETILNEKCDSTRHDRVFALKQVIHQRLVNGHAGRRRKTSVPVSSN